MYNYGKRIKEYRTKYNLTQGDLAAKLGMVQQGVQRLEKGELDLRLSSILLMCEKMEVSADWLLGLDE